MIKIKRIVDEDYIIAEGRIINTALRQDSVVVVPTTIGLRITEKNDVCQRWRVVGSGDVLVKVSVRHKKYVF